MCREGAGAELAARVTSVRSIRSKAYGLTMSTAKVRYGSAKWKLNINDTKGCSNEKKTFMFTVAPFCIVCGYYRCAKSIGRNASHEAGIGHNGDSNSTNRDYGKHCLSV